MGHGPVADAAHVDVFLLQLALLHQPAPHRPVWVTVLVGIADAQLPAVLQLDAPGALDLQELQVHRIAQPGQHRRLHALAADGVGVVVGLEHVAVETAAQALALEFGIDAVQRHHHQVLRHAVDRHRSALGGLQAARIDRLVVAGDQALGAVVRRAQAIYLQIVLQEVAHRAGILRHLGGATAGRRPHRVAGQAGAGRAPGIEAGQQVGVAGKRQFAPVGLLIGGDPGRLGGAGVAVATRQQRDQRRGAEQQPAPVGNAESHAMNS
ncbi:hypothetical protein D9M71_252380 [compost metagenome]